MEYYIAQKSCLMGVHKRVLLSVGGGKVDFYKGHVKDKFELDSEGKLSCTTENSDILLPYAIYGPLTNEEFEKVISWNFGDFTQERKIRIDKLTTFKFLNTKN